MPPDRDRNKPIIFVGNIPYGLTEEQITEIFNSAGRVVSFRLVYDRETGRPKGFGFAEYSDHETAASAVRNLDNYEIMGRKLRVDFSHEGNADDEVNNSGPGPSGGGGLPPLPSGTDVPAGLSAPDAISQTLKALPVPQLLDILGQMKTLVSTDPIKATDLLRAAPQLSYAIFQALLLMNLVDTSVLTQVIENAATSAPAPAPPASTAAPTGGFYPAPQSVPPPVPTPVQTYAPPPPAPAPVPTPVSQAPQAPQDPQRAALLQQVMSLTQEQIAALPTEQQTQILLLKRQLLQGGGF